MMVVFDTPPDDLKINKKNAQANYKSPTGKSNYFNAPIVTNKSALSDPQMQTDSRSTSSKYTLIRKSSQVPSGAPPAPLTKPPAIPKAGIPTTSEVPTSIKISRPTLSSASQTSSDTLPKLRMAASTPDFEVKRKPSVSDLLSRLTQPNQSAINRLHEFHRDGAKRNVSSPLTSSSSKLSSFSVSNPKSPPLRAVSLDDSHSSIKSPLSSEKTNNTKSSSISSPNNIVGAKITARRSVSHTITNSKRSGSTSSTDSATKPSSPQKKATAPQPQDLPISRPIAVVDLSNARPAIKEPAQVITRKAPPLPASVAPPTPQTPGLTKTEAELSEFVKSPESPESPEEPMDFLMPKQTQHYRRPSLPAPFLNIKTRHSTNELRHKSSYNRAGVGKPLPPPPSSATSSTFPESPTISDSAQAEIDDMKARNKQLRKMLNDALSELDQASVELAIIRASRDALQHQVNGYKQALEKPAKYQYMLQDDEFARNECLRFDLDSNDSTDAYVYSGAWDNPDIRYNETASLPPSYDSSD